MAKFFIERPVFAWVVALAIMVLGLVSLTQLPVAQYPSVAPPSINISTMYPGASAQDLEDSVLAVIEREMNGTPGLLYMESSAQASGAGSIRLSFKQGTDVDKAQVDVQNRLARATPRLPSAVTQQGVVVDKATSNFLMMAMLTAKGGTMSDVALGDYASRSILPELQRVQGVGQVQLFGSEQAMRVWLDPMKLESFGLSSVDVVSAIKGQNTQVASGSIGALPSESDQTVTASVTVKGQLGSVAEFESIVVRASNDGALVRLRDVATVELGSQAYATSSRLNGQPAAGLGIQLSSSGNALATAEAVSAKLKDLSQYFPAGVSYSIPYDSSKFVEISIKTVVVTLLEAVVLVFVVMFLFLQNWRYTVIPTLVVPVALLGTMAALLALGFSINVLTMFGMVLVIGIVVDDAIVVVENVERIMSEEGLPPKEATRKAMGQISGAIVGVTVVLVSVFVPLAFFAGSIGNIYKQFSAVMVSAIAFSALMALSLTPALCATLLKPTSGGHPKSGFFGWLNKSFDSAAKGYERAIIRVLRKAGRYMLIYIAIIGAVAVFYARMPTSFLPSEDQGVVLVSVQLPAGASIYRTQAVMSEIESVTKTIPEVDYMVSVLGFSFTGQGQNAAMAFVSLKDWAERSTESQSSMAVAGRIMGGTQHIRDAFIFALNPPPIPELGVSSGFNLRLQDRGGAGRDALLEARNQLLGMAATSKVLTQVRSDGPEDAPQVRLAVDREKALAHGVPFEAISSVLSTAMGSTYVNDFPNRGRLQRVVVQADAAARMQADDLLNLSVMNTEGELVPLSVFTDIEWLKGAQQTTRYNGYSSVSISGAPAPGYSTGDAMAEMTRLAAQLPNSFGIEWTGQSFEERQAGAQSMILYSFAILAVFLCLAALYESWTIPLAVILVVPLGALGVVLAAMLRGYANDIYFQIGLITVIGLSAKNAILIVEFAKDLQAKGMSSVAAALIAARLRFRPILMTSLAFGLGVLPLVLASGASSASQRAIGTGVLGGMVTGTALAIIFVPIFYVIVCGRIKHSASPSYSGVTHD